MYSKQIVALLIGLVACTPGDDESDLASGLVVEPIARFDTLLSSESARIGGLGGLAIDAGSRVWFTDVLNNRMLILDSAGHEVGAIGREGSGPGEFRRPSSIVLSRSGVLVFDWGNSRLQLFDLDGNYLEARAVTVPAYVAADMNESGDLAVPTLGREGSLVQVIRQTGEAPVYVGTGREPPPQQISLRLIREQMQAGEMPREFRNNVLPVVHADGGVTLVIQAEGIVERFMPDGQLLWSRALPESEVASALETFYSGWEGPSVPEVVRAGEAIGDEIWLMLDAAEGPGSIILVMDAQSGVPQKRLPLDLDARASFFAVAPDRRHLVVYLPDNASLLRAQLTANEDSP